MTSALVLGGSIHALLGAGQRAMAELLPGSGRMPSQAQVVFMRRPALEAVVRRRVLDLPNVVSVPAVVKGLLFADGRITGVRTQADGPLVADLVVDATGRNSKAVDWLGEHGFRPPATKELRSYVGYATATVALPEDVFPDGVAGIISTRPEVVESGKLACPKNRGTGITLLRTPRGWKGQEAGVRCSGRLLIPRRTKLR